MDRPALPHRPLTVGELLDSAVQLVRERALILLPVAGVFAVAEQALLHPLRWLLGVDYQHLFQVDFWADLGSLWLVLAIGFGIEAFLITVLGVWTGRAAAADLIGAPADHTGLLRPRARDVGSLVVVAPAAGLLTALGSLLGPFWVLAYNLFGLAGPAIGMERRGPFGALGRAAALAFRGGMRTIWVRSLGYLAWLLLRIGFFLGMLKLLDYLPLSQQTAFWFTVCGFVVANAAAYVFLAALDAAVLTEARFRNEGLDIWLGRAGSHSALSTDVLAAGR